MTWCGCSASPDWSGRGPHPGWRRRIEERRQAAGDARMVGVEPADLRGGQHVGFNEPPVDRRQRQGLECVERLLGARNRWRFDDEDEVLDANAVVVGLVVAGLVRPAHATLA